MYFLSLWYHESPYRQEENTAAAAAVLTQLLLTEGLAVGALVSSGIHLMRTNKNPLQGAEVGILAMVGALLNGTLNALVCMAIHRNIPPFRRDGLRLSGSGENIPIRFAQTIDFFSHSQYNSYGICEFSQICIIKAETRLWKERKLCHDL